MKFYLLAALCASALLTLGAKAQSLSPEEIQNLLDRELAEANPYAALLNDPDPKRSIGALRIMMESGDPKLIAIAKEFGLLSADPRVQRATVEYYMATGPRLAVEFDAAETKENDWGNFKRLISIWGGSYTAELKGYASFKIGEFDPAQGCFTHEGHKNCGVRINETGIFVLGSRMSGRVEVNEVGELVGMTKMERIDELVPVKVKLLD